MSVNFNGLCAQQALGVSRERRGMCHVNAILGLSHPSRGRMTSFFTGRLGFIGDVKEAVLIGFARLPEYAD